MTINPPYWHPSTSKAFLLDWDGVLADTKLDFSGIREKYYDGRRALLLEEAETLPADKRKALMKDLYDLEMQGAEKATPVAGAQELLAWLKAKKIPYCVVSRNCMDSIKLAAEKVDIALPELVFARDNCELLKPDPRVLAKAAQEMGVQHSDCVFIGDFLYDLQGALRAGMRSILVQRVQPEWASWYDVAFDTLADMVASLKNPSPIVPWEYREIAAKKGEKWMNCIHDITLLLPDSTSPTLDCWLVRAAALGIGAIAVPENMVFGPDEWRHNMSFDPAYMGYPLIDAIRSFLAPRFPMLRVIPEDENVLKAPKNSLDLIRFLERKIY